MSKKKSTNTTKKSENLNTIVITSLTFIAIITIVVCVCIMCGRGNNNKPGGNASTTLNLNEYINEGEYLKINAKDCAIYNGDVIKLTCSSNPVEYSQGVNWSSSDTSVATVTFDGTVTAMKEGVTAITATHGVLTSSIIVKVIKEEQASDDDFPFYEPIIPTEPDTTKPVSPTKPTTTKPVTPTEPGTTKPVTPTEPNTTKPVTPTEPNTTKPVTPTEPTTTKPSTPIEPQTTEPVKPNETPKETESQSAKDTIMSVLPEYGFDVYTEDSFIYKEDGNYLGQVIVGHGFTQIYVMTRTTSFDKQIKGFLAEILPVGYNKAFNNMVNSNKDMTFTTDGYTVRVVASPNGGHTQLIIYY